ncbi:hypothetical protein INS49_009230 [Diaporthe citri]|uniref:uncharacterized protein n=1 Tax=Diaporthe citri TaxID=83186 RepID=UPI001C813709|nr:uncharacterized protein INS49_009230 [Diaporthe citri]KAG6361011.1 hypothetical protein INS49_009230 [Diaporthe citri]
MAGVTSALDSSMRLSARTNDVVESWHHAPPLMYALHNEISDLVVVLDNTSAAAEVATSREHAKLLDDLGKPLVEARRLLAAVESSVADKVSSQAQLDLEEIHGITKDKDQKSLARLDTSEIKVETKREILKEREERPSSRDLALSLALPFVERADRKHTTTADAEDEKTGVAKVLESIDAQKIAFASSTASTRSKSLPTRRWWTEGAGKEPWLLSQQSLRDSQAGARALGAMSPGMTSLEVKYVFPGCGAWTFFPGMIMLAVKTDDLEALKMCLRPDPDSINCVVPGTGWGPLHIAIELGFIKSTRFLLQQGSDLDQVDDYGRSAGGSFIFNLPSGRYEGEMLRQFSELISTSKYLEDLELSHLSKVVSTGPPSAKTTPLSAPSSMPAPGVNDTPAAALAARWGGLGVLEFLVDSGADIEADNGVGHTSLVAALLQNQHACLRFLLGRGADYLLPGLPGENILHLVAQLGDAETMRIFSAVGMRGLDIVGSNKAGLTPREIFLRRPVTDKVQQAAFEELLASVDGLEEGEDGLPDEDGDLFFDAEETR